VDQSSGTPKLSIASWSRRNLRTDDSGSGLSLRWIGSGEQGTVPVSLMPNVPPGVSGLGSGLALGLSSRWGVPASGVDATASSSGVFGTLDSGFGASAVDGGSGV